MDLALKILAIYAYGYVCLLPFIFFKKDGKFNLMWSLTAWPYTACVIYVILVHLNYVQPLYSSEWTIAISTILYIMSISLISKVIGTHKVPLALWHQDNDAPHSIVTYGPYAKIRHPFYTSFILGLIAGCIAFPHPFIILLSLYKIVMLNITAAKEERKLSASTYGKEYQEYMKKSGRFIPKVF
jgi:protein-S-isoprenylcysteine O-methyltransferase Ste14